MVFLWWVKVKNLGRGVVKKRDRWGGKVFLCLHVFIRAGCGWVGGVGLWVGFRGVWGGGGGGVIAAQHAKFSLPEGSAGAVK